MQSNKEVAMQSNMPFVSIIINCFNGEKYIGDAINFALRQTYPDFELIIWDNQSTDNTLSVIKTFHDPRINYCYAPEHTTLARARNNAVECAKGAWIAFLDCDDIWLPEKLFLQVAVIKAAPCSLSIVYGRSDLLVENAAIKTTETKRLRSLYLNRPLPTETAFEELLNYNSFFVFSSVMIKKEDYLAINGIDSKYKYAEDYDLFLKIAENKTVRAVNEKIVTYRIHGSNLTSQYKRELLLESKDILNRYKHNTSHMFGLEKIDFQLSILDLKKGKVLSFLSYFTSFHRISIFFHMFQKRFRKGNS